MATFKIGQRVRIVRASSLFYRREATVIGLTPPNAHFSVTGRRGLGYQLDVDGYGAVDTSGVALAYPAEDLAPLTDPKADAFIARLKKLGSKPAPVQAH